MANEDLRQAIAGLRITSILRLGLVGSLQEYLVRFREQSGVDTVLIMDDGAQCRFPASTEVQLQAMIHEALSNIRKHAHAQHAKIQFALVDGRTAIIVPVKRSARSCNETWLVPSRFSAVAISASLPSTRRRRTQAWLSFSMRTQGSDNAEMALNLRRDMLAERPMRSAA